VQTTLQKRGNNSKNRSSDDRVTNCWNRPRVGKDGDKYVVDRQQEKNKVIEAGNDGGTGMKKGEDTPGVPCSGAKEAHTLDVEEKLKSQKESRNA